MKAVFLCDATAQLGFGHLIRCIALAEAARSFGVECIFFGRYDPAAREQIADAGFRCNEMPDLVNTYRGNLHLSELMTQEVPSFIVLDSYNADDRYLSSLNALGWPAVVIDDFGALKAYSCDIVLNFTLEAPSISYPDGPLFLLGPSYFLARRQLVERRSQSIERDRRGPARNVLIAIGGADPKHIAMRVVRILGLHHCSLCLHVVASAEAELSDVLTGFAPGSQVLPRQPDLSEQLLWADCSITGGGLIKYESGFMGVPAAAISQNEGQAGETRALAQAGLVFDLGLADARSDVELARTLDEFITDSARRAALAERMVGIFPPNPSSRAVKAIIDRIGG
jgi:spore coat polysaccharide biosynthesis predicted glycosyltransferase SpsG